MSGAQSRAVPRARRHTLHFLAAAASYRPVYLQTVVDMSAIAAERAVAVPRFGYTAYLVAAAARAIAARPQANAFVTGHLRPRLHAMEQINAKITLDKTLDGERVVVSAVIAGADAKSVAEIAREIGGFRAEDAGTAARYAPMRKLQALPVPAGRLAYWLAMSDPKRRAASQGSFAVTSLGHSVVDGFFPMIGATLTFGAGRVRTLPVWVDGAIRPQPSMQLTMAFDHRVLDGALAADILADVVEKLQAAPATGRTVQVEQAA